MRAGFLMNLWECSFLQGIVQFLAMDLWWYICTLVNRILVKWPKVSLPCTIWKLHSVLGILLWASKFVPVYKNSVRLIEVLLAKGGAGIDAEVYRYLEVYGVGIVPLLVPWFARLYCPNNTQCRGILCMLFLHRNKSLGLSTQWSYLANV